MADRKLPEVSYLRLGYLLFVYFGVYLFILPYLFAKLTLWYDPSATMIPLSLQYFAYGITFILIIYGSKPVLIKSYQLLKGNLIGIIKTVIGHACILLLLNMVLSIFVSLLTKTTTSNNQSEIIQSSYAQPVLNMIVTIGFAPIVEECVFRGGIYLKLRSRLGFFASGAISAACFGLIHVLSSVTNGNLIDISYLLVYAGIGFLLAYTMEKTKTIYACMLVHAICNLVSLMVIYIN